jgi:AraC-like DNA-binding protein
MDDKLIEKAKEKLSVTQLSISEIAYALGFTPPVLKAPNNVILVLVLL